MASKTVLAAPARGMWLRAVGWVALALVVCAVPIYASEFWLDLGFAVCAAAVGAIGLNLLTGATGQLSLAHAFFLAVGALSYCVLSGEPARGTEGHLIGLGLPPLVGMVGAAVISGIAGLLFAPVSSRLRGIYLGIASLGLVFLGQHVLNTATPLSGGFNGRPAPSFELFGFVFDTTDPMLYVLNVPFGRSERLWFLGAVVLAGCVLFARGVLGAAPGRALRMIRDNELAASAMGVDVRAYKAKAFVMSSMYAGLAGVLYALSVGSVAPQSFTLDVSVQYLAMIVLGGLGSVWGAVAGAAFVTALPIVLQQYSASIPFLSDSPGTGLTPAHAARYLYGAAIIAVIMLKPSGLAGLFGRRQSRRPRAAAPSAASGPPPVPSVSRSQARL